MNTSRLWSRALQSALLLATLVLAACPAEEEPSVGPTAPCQVLVQVQGRAGGQIFSTQPGAGSLNDYTIADGRVTPRLPNPCSNAVAERLASSACAFCNRSSGQCEGLLRSIFTQPPAVCSPCGDGTCGEGETPLTCPADCVGEGTCGNSLCEGDETAEGCPQDCDTACGDGLCIDRESPETCPQDCNFTRGDGLCTFGENPVNSPADCSGQRLGQPCQSDADCLGAVCAVDGLCDCRQDTGGICATQTCGDGYCQTYENETRCARDCCGVASDSDRRRPGPTVCTEPGNHCLSGAVVACVPAAQGSCGAELESMESCEFGCSDGQCNACPPSLPGVRFCDGPTLRCEGIGTVAQCVPFPGIAGCWYEETIDCEDVVGRDPNGMLRPTCTAQGCSLGCPQPCEQGALRCSLDLSRIERCELQPSGSICSGWVPQESCTEGRCNAFGAQPTCETIPVPTISNLSPDTAVIGAQVRIFGSGFGAERGDVSFSPQQRAFVTFWSDTAVHVRVPAGTTTGAVTLTTVEQQVATSTFTLADTAQTVLQLITLQDGRPGDELFLLGEHFGEGGEVVFWTTSTARTSDAAWEAGVKAEVLAWDETVIHVRVPELCGLNVRGQPVCGPLVSAPIVVRTSAGGAAASFQSFTLGTAVTSVEVCGESRGAPFDLAIVRGYRFGTAQQPLLNGIGFGGVAATFWIASEELLYAVIPLGARTGPVTYATSTAGFEGPTFEVLPIEDELHAGTAGYPVSDSPTALCSDGSNPVDCATAPLQDGGRVDPAPDFVTNADTIEDRISGLMWQATPSATMSRLEAQCYCRDLDLGGHTDWRLPWPSDLLALQDYGSTNSPPLPAAFVVGSEIGWWGRMWSRDGRGVPTASSVERQGLAASLNTALALEGTSRAARCVRTQALPTEPTRFVVAGSGADQTVLDQWSGLMWEGQHSNYGASWSEVLAHCDGRTTGGHDDWRVPTAKELLTLEDHEYYRDLPWPGVNQVMTARNTWSSTVSASTRQPLGISNNAGTYLTPFPASSRLFAICVRDAR